MTTHSDHIDADHESQSDSNDLISQFFSEQGTEIPSITAVVLLRLLVVQTWVNQP